MNKIQRLFFLSFVLSVAVAVAVVAHAQSEQPARTWIGGGLTFTKSTAEGSEQIITGAHLNAAYDLRHGLQARGFGEYRRRPAIKNLFTGKSALLEANSELIYGAALVYHVPGEGSARPMVGSGVSVIRHFFRATRQPILTHHYGRRSGAITIYNSSVNPFIVVGSSFGRKTEATFSYYFPDTYGHSNLRGYGVDHTYTRNLVGSLHLRVGAKGKYWIYREGTENHEKKSGEVSVFVGFHFQ